MKETKQEKQEANKNTKHGNKREMMIMEERCRDKR